MKKPWAKVPGYMHVLPDPDLVIRTSGEARISNFLLWQSAYAEYEFIDTLWPDFTAEEFGRLCAAYGGRDRRLRRGDRRFESGDKRWQRVTNGMT